MDPSSVYSELEVRHIKNKAFPHPVLRIGSADYEGTKFHSTIVVERIKGTTRLRVSATFTLTDPTLLDLIQNESASYAILIKCPKTFLRLEVLSFKPRVEHEFADGDVVDSLEVTSYVVSTSTINDFYASHWHRDYFGLRYSIRPGSVLAIHDTHDYRIDTVDEEDIGSILNIQVDSNIKQGYWTCDLYDDRINILVAQEDGNDIYDIRKKINGTNGATYLLNGFYLPVLVYVLIEADKNVGDYEEYRWFSALNKRLEFLESDRLGSSNSQRLADAQKLFRGPFGRLIGVMGDAEYETN